MFHYYAAMQKSEYQGTYPSPVRQPVLLGLFTGTAIGAGYLLAGVPNVELMTLIIALAGASLGPLRGFISGAVAAAAYSLGSPLGLPAPLLLLGQALGLGWAGIWGGWLFRPVLNFLGSGSKTAAIACSVGLGLLATLTFDLLTNLAIIGTFALEPRVVLGQAVPFALIHLGTNAVIFALVFAPLAARLRGLSRSPLQGRGQTLVGILILLAMMGTGPAALAEVVTGPGEAKSEASGTVLPDSVISSPSSVQRPTSGPAAAFGWKRPLWTPYTPSTVQWLDWFSPFLTMRDGGHGSPILLLGEAGTTSQPAFTRDGIPLGTGHALVDDPWLVSNQGVQVAEVSLGPSLVTGAGSFVNVATMDATPDRAVGIYRGLKGPHETYHRGFSLLTAQAAWRVGFEFDESLDNEGYNTSLDPDYIFDNTEGFRGHAKIRSSRTRLERRLDAETGLVLEYSTGRKTKDDLPAWGADHQEIWATGTAATLRSRLGDWRWRAIIHSEQRDTRFGDRPTAAGIAEDSRFLESTRQGVILDLVADPAEPDSTGQTGRSAASGSFLWNRLTGVGEGRNSRPRLSVRFSRWALADSGSTRVPETETTPRADGHELRTFAGAGQSWGPLQVDGGLALTAGSHGGQALDGGVVLSTGNPRHSGKLGLLRTSRRPRSDELLTPVVREVNGRSLLLLPNVDLNHEKAWQVQAQGGIRVLGFDLAVDASLRRLTEGITWVENPAAPDTGRWQNALDLNTSRVTGSVARQGRFLGWGRAKLEGTWQSFDERQGRAFLLPPEQYIRLHLMWENHFFKEDGILQLALLSTRRGAMADPWDPSRSVQLPPATWHDLLVGFRLVGTHLSLAIRNITDQRVQTSAATYAPGREIDMRLHWVFHY